jgi:hypothetical protein
MKVALDQFVAACKEDGVTRVRERTTSPDDYKAAYTRVFTKMDEVQHTKSLGKKITSVTLPEGGDAKAQQLTGGIFGSWESWSAPDRNWVLYKGQHMDFVLDLGEVTDVRTINMDFLNSQAQPDWNLLILPSYVTYATSTDGQTFGKEVKVDNPNNPDPKVNPRIANIPVYSFHAELEAPARARYIKVHGESILKMPSWHIRAGFPAELRTDQIVVS